MSEINPAGFLQNAGATHTAQIMRGAFNVLASGAASASSLRARGGVNPALGLFFAVIQNGSPNMSVNVGSGHALVPGSQANTQGVYSCMNDATVNKTIAASDPSLPRIDIVVLKVEDSVFSGGTDAWSIAVVTGTPAGSPAVPTAPNNALILAQVAVGAGVTTIVNANITDVRYFLVGSGGILPVRSKAERDALFDLYDGYAVWRQDIDMLNIYTGSTWQFYGRPSTAAVATSQTTTSTSYTDLATSGPAVSLETGTTALVTVTAGISNTVSGSQISAMGFAISGATTVAASDSFSLQNQALAAVAGAQIVASASFYVTSLTAGTNTFTSKYRVTGGTGSFALRSIIVEPK